MKFMSLFSVIILTLCVADVDAWWKTRNKSSSRTRSSSSSRSSSIAFPRYLDTQGLIASSTQPLRKSKKIKRVMHLPTGGNMPEVNAAPDCSNLSVQYKMSNGCTAIFDYKFTSACDIHDMCYYCGFINGVDRKTCDTNFLSNMVQICSSVSSAREERKCRRRARKFYIAVRSIGFAFYNEEKLSNACELDWVARCLK